MADACRDCKYWVETHEHDGELLGECHRFPPRSFYNRIYTIRTTPKAYVLLKDHFRITADDSWCGEFKKVKRGKE